MPDGLPIIGQTEEEWELNSDWIKHVNGSREKEVALHDDLQERAQGKRKLRLVLAKSRPNLILRVGPKGKKRWMTTGTGSAWGDRLMSHVAEALESRGQSQESIAEPDRREQPEGKSDADDYRKNGTLAKAFLNWFGPWDTDPEKASKVVNPKGEPQETYEVEQSQVVKDGKPVVVYHGTAYGEFDAFDKSKQDPNALYGAGFYFTEDRTVAEHYMNKDASPFSRPLDRVDLKNIYAFFQIHPYSEKYRSGLGETPWDGIRRTFVNLHAGTTDWKYAEQALAVNDDVPEVAELLQELGITVRQKHQNMKAVYLNIRNPFDPEAPLTEETAKRLAKAIETHPAWKDTGAAHSLGTIPRYYPTMRAEDALARVSNQVEIDPHERETSDGQGGKKTVMAHYSLSKKYWQNLLMHAGYDGITHIGGNNMGGGHNHRVWIAFEPEQIKAVDNVGTFSSDTANIYKGLRLRLSKSVVHAYDRTVNGKVVHVAPYERETHQLDFEPSGGLAQATRKVPDLQHLHGEAGEDWQAHWYYHENPKWAASRLHVNLAKQGWRVTRRDITQHKARILDAKDPQGKVHFFSISHRVAARMQDKPFDWSKIFAPKTQPAMMKSVPRLILSKLRTRKVPADESIRPTHNLAKSWSGDLQAKVNKTHGIESHWVTLHGRGKEGDGMHVLIAPVEGHHRVVWAPKGSGFEHLRIDKLGTKEEWKAKSQERKEKEKQRVTSLSESERKSEREKKVKESEERQTAHVEYAKKLSKVLGVNIIPKETRVAEKKAREVLKSEDETKPEKSEAEDKEGRGEERGEKGLTLRKVNDIIEQHAFNKIAADVVGSELEKPAEYNDLPDTHKKILDNMTTEQAQQVAQHALERIRKEKGFPEAEMEDDDSFAEKIDPGKAVIGEALKRHGDEARAIGNVALWQRVTAQGQGLHESFRAGGHAALSALATDLGMAPGLSDNIVETLGVRNTARLLAANTKDKAVAIKRVLQQHEDEGSERVKKTLAEVERLDGEIKANEVAVEKDVLSDAHAKNYNARLINRQQEQLGQIAGSLEAGSEFIDALKRGGDVSMRHSDIRILEHKAQALGLDGDDYDIAKDDDGRLTLTVKQQGYGKILGSGNALSQDMQKLHDRKIQKHAIKGLNYDAMKGGDLHPDQAAAALYPHQSPGRAAFANLNVGKGKTLTAIAFAQEHVNQTKGKGRTLYVTLANLRQQVGDDVTKFAPGLKTAIADGTAEQRGTAYSGDASMVVTGISTVGDDLERILKEGHFDALVIDEVHRMVSGKDAISEQAKKIQELREGLESGAKKRGGLKVLTMSGSSQRNDISELWKIGNLTKPGALGNMTNFLTKYMEIGSGGNAYQSAMQRALQAEMKPFTLYGSGTVPAPERQERDPIGMSDAQRSAYGAVEKKWEAKDISTGRRYASLYNIIHDQGYDTNPKAQEAIRVLNEEHEAGNKSIIFAQHLSAVKTLLEGATKAAGGEGTLLAYTGATPKQRRREIQQTVNTGIAHVTGVRVSTPKGEGIITKITKAKGVPTGYTVKLDSGKQVDTKVDDTELRLKGVIATDAGSTGLNLQGASTMVEYDRPWTDERREQRGGRIARMGQTKPTKNIVLRSEAPFEREKDFVLDRKAAQYNATRAALAGEAL